MRKILPLLLMLCCVSCDKMGMKKKEDHDSKLSWLFVIHARDASLSSTELHLKNPDPSVLAFTDRPVRKTAMLPYAEFVKNWPTAFDYKNPNATISYFDKEGNYHGVVVELIDPKVVDNSIVFGIKAIDNANIVTTNQIGETAVFIDGGVSIGTEKEAIERGTRNYSSQNAGSSKYGSSGSDRYGSSGSTSSGSNRYGSSSSSTSGSDRYGSSDMDQDKQCTEKSCKAAEEPMEMEEEKECTMPTCKPKAEEPMDMEEDKECEMPSCKSN